MTNERNVDDALTGDNAAFADKSDSAQKEKDGRMNDDELSALGMHEVTTDDESYTVEILPLEPGELYELNRQIQEGRTGRELPEWSDVNGSTRAHFGELADAINLRVGFQIAG